MLTKRGEALSGQPWPQYPRPLLKRDSFLNLNGEWEFSAGDFSGTIRVPFPPESKLSGVEQIFPEGTALTYKRTFALPDGFRKDRVLLHFGAADQETEVLLNGKALGTHVGGYDSFCFDITDALLEENQLEVRVTDRLSSFVLPYGKQTKNPGGMWYTPVSGIWQTVWLESVPKQYVRRISVTTGKDFAEIDLGDETLHGTVTVRTPDGTVSAKLVQGETKVKLPSPRLWCPEDPYLYRFTVEVGEDKVDSYFALRTISVETVDGVPRICLNGKPVFLHAVLDQGYWPDGLFTPANPQCFDDDIRAMQAMGFNTLRKHIKAEPQLFYEACDRLGMLVMQDMVNNGDYAFFRDTALPTVGVQKRKDKHLHKDEKTRKAFLSAMKKTVSALAPHPCVCYWTIFNEGWGQFDSTAVYKKLKALDDTRVIDSASGWFRGGESDVESIHVYFRKFRFKGAKKPTVLSEFGGYCYAEDGHVWNPDKSYGYRNFTNQFAYEDALVTLYETQIIPAVEKGLCGAVYTQLSDVEEEINGLVTYDREVWKVAPERMREIARKLTL